MTKRSRSRGDSPPSPSERFPGFQSTPSSMPPSSPISPRGKYAQLDDDSGQQVPEVMRCSLPPHKEVLCFSTYEDYEVHYIHAHVNRCSECGKNFPTDNFLALHIEENHDPLIEARRARGEKTFGCFVEGCERRCSTPQKRRMHLIDKHVFPRTYNFFIVNDGIDRRSSMLRGGPTNRRRVSTPSSPQYEGRLRRRQLSQSLNEDSSPSYAKNDQLSQNAAATTHPASHVGGTKSTEIDDITTSMSALKFVPTSVAMRRNKGDINR